MTKTCRIFVDASTKDPGGEDESFGWGMVVAYADPRSSDDQEIKYLYGKIPDGKVKNSTQAEEYAIKRAIALIKDEKLYNRSPVEIHTDQIAVHGVSLLGPKAINSVFPDSGLPRGCGVTIKYASDHTKSDGFKRRYSNIGMRAADRLADIHADEDTAHIRNIEEYVLLRVGISTPLRDGISQQDAMDELRKRIFNPRGERKEEIHLPPVRARGHVVPTLAKSPKSVPTPKPPLNNEAKEAIAARNAARLDNIPPEERAVPITDEEKEKICGDVARALYVDRSQVDLLIRSIGNALTVSIPKDAARLEIATRMYRALGLNLTSASASRISSEIHKKSLSFAVGEYSFNAYQDKNDFVFCIPLSTNQSGKDKLLKFVSNLQTQEHTTIIRPYTGGQLTKYHPDEKVPEPAAKSAVPYVPKLMTATLYDLPGAETHLDRMRRLRDPDAPITRK